MLREPVESSIAMAGNQLMNSSREPKFMMMGMKEAQSLVTAIEHSCREIKKDSLRKDISLLLSLCENFMKVVAS